MNTYFQNKTNTELIRMLKVDVLKEAAGIQLLKQSPSKNELREMIRKKVQVQAATELLEFLETKNRLLSMAIGKKSQEEKDEIGETLLKMELDNEDLRFMLQRGCAMEAAWQRLLSQFPSTGTMATLLELSPYRNTIAEYLLTQPADNRILYGIINHTNHKAKAWELLKLQQPDFLTLTWIMKGELAEEVWEVFLQQQPKNSHFIQLIQMNEEMEGRAAAEVLKRSPTKEDLVYVARYSSLWKPAWEELLRQGIDNLGLLSLTRTTTFELRELAWELLKRQSPTNREIRCAIDMEEVEEDDEFPEIVARYLLQCSPSNDDLVYLICAVPGVRDLAVDMLLKQSPGKDDLARVKRYYPGRFEKED